VIDGLTEMLEYLVIRPRLGETSCPDEDPESTM